MIQSFDLFLVNFFKNLIKMIGLQSKKQLLHPFGRIFEKIE